jgi:hypothetical protein
MLHLPKRGTMASGDWRRRKENLEKTSALASRSLDATPKIANGSKTTGRSLPLTLAPAPGNFTLWQRLQTTARFDRHFQSCTEDWTARAMEGFGTPQHHAAGN